MLSQNPPIVARGLTDGQDRLLTADEPLAELQETCGGLMPGVLAVPELLDLVQQCRELGLRIAREFRAYDGADFISGFARVHPLDDGSVGGCEIMIENWQRAAADLGSGHDIAMRLDAIDRAGAEITARLDADQRVQLITSNSKDAQELVQASIAEPFKIWTDYVQLQGVSHQQPLHWRLLDGVECRLPGSDRNWRVRLFPVGSQSAAPRGFELMLIADRPLVMPDTTKPDHAPHTRLIGSALTPVLRQPIARIIANAETIRSKLAGPLKQDYSDYAGDIAGAGKHLSGMLDDLADLEVVEAPSFSTIKEKVDLSDVAKRAAGILGVRARAKSITIDLADEGDRIVATAEFRRVLQILINLIGNAIAYSPEGSTVTVTPAQNYAGLVSVTVSDEGPGVNAEQAERIFDKFERLGRDSDGGLDQGSGLGLYISKRLALAMHGDLTLTSDPTNGGGAEFTLSLPVYA